MLRFLTLLISLKSSAATPGTLDAVCLTVSVECNFNLCFFQGGGAFYGPKIDIKIQDAIGRKWQCSTIQLDFNLPARFDVSYIDSDQSRQRPIMIHRAIFGSLERFFGILVENYAGAFPLWLAPVQCRLLAVNDGVLPYAQEVRRRAADFPSFCRCWCISRTFVYFSAQFLASCLLWQGQVPRPRSFSCAAAL